MPTCSSARELVVSAGRRRRKLKRGKAATSGLLAIGAQEVREQMLGLHRVCVSSEASVSCAAWAHLAHLFRQKIPTPFSLTDSEMNQMKLFETDLFNLGSR